MKKAIWSVAILVVILSVVAGIVGCAGPAPTPTPTPTPKPTPAPSPTPTPTPGKTYTWTFAINKQTATPYWGFAPHPRFQEMVEAATNGQIKFDTKTDIVTMADVLTAVIDGRVDAGVGNPVFASGTFPLWDFGSFPFYWLDSPFEYEKAVRDPALEKLLQPTYHDAGLHYTVYWSDGRLDAIWGKKALPTVADLKGLKVRVGGILATETMKALGAAPLTLGVTEIADALQRGTVDAVATSFGFGGGMGLADLVRTVSVWQFLSEQNQNIVVNLKKWNELPPNLQDAFTKASIDWQGQIHMAAMMKNNMSQTLVGAVGVKIVVPEKAETDKARALALQIVLDKYVQLAGPKGKDVLAIVSKYASGAK